VEGFGLQKTGPKALAEPISKRPRMIGVVLSE